jgi:hypothetical protein
MQELEESVYWMELLIEGEIVPEYRLGELMDEANQLMAILVTCVKSVRKRMRAKG